MSVHLRNICQQHTCDEIIFDTLQIQSSHWLEAKEADIINYSRVVLRVIV